LSSNTDYPKPSNEQERIEALERYDILDTPPEEAFDRITRMATKIFDVPVSLVSLIDEERQWWKSCIGVDQRQTDRRLAFCNYPVTTKKTFVIENALEDERFKDNRLVTGDMHIRAYAGVPLITEDNHVLGSLCVIDTEPREFSTTEIEILEGLGEETYSQLELRRTKKQFQKQTQELQILENAVSSAQEG
jgi:GAF domain-containing protein